MWTYTVLLIIACSWGLSESRKSLKDQLAMLKQEQWRDKERIEALERKFLIREERGSSHHALGDVLDEVRKEVEELTEELKGRQEFEAAVEAMEIKMEHGLNALRHMATEIRALKDEQKIMWNEIAAVKKNNMRQDRRTEYEQNPHDPFSQEGSGDLVEESFLPVGTTVYEISEVKRVPHQENGLRHLWEEQKSYFKDLEEKVYEERSLLREHLEEGRRKSLEIQNYCTELVSNATEAFLATTSQVEELAGGFSRLKRDVTRLEFNVVQSQAALDVITNDRTADRGTIRDLKNEWNEAEIQLEQQRIRLLNLELVTTNLTLQNCKAEYAVSTRELKFANLETWLSQAERKLDDSERRAELTRRSDENSLRSLREAIITVSKKADDATSQVLQLATQHATVKEDLEKFVRQLPEDCSEASQSGVFLIQVNGMGPIEVYCDADTEGGPWMTFQKRFNGSENFFRNWAEYQKGFGNLSSEFWLGNEVLHRITNTLAPMKLRIDLWDVVGRYLYAEYERFVVKSEEELYSLEVGSHKGNATDALRHHNGMGFSTLDRDNDASSTNCAVHYTGGWWYQHCQRADLNGRYALGMTWYDDYSRDWIQLDKVEMKMVTKKSST